MEIGLFQLENLFLTNNRFCFFDLREKIVTVPPPPLDKILKATQKIRPQDIKNHLAQQKVARELPIILLCENGKVSIAVAGELEAQGFQNVYVVELGIEGLLAEL